MGRDEKILAAAQRLFHERGFNAVGVDEIGERAGITGPAIYRHFSGKDEILATLFDRAIDELLVRVGGEFEDPYEELRFLANAHAAFVLEQQELASIMIRDERALERSYRRRYQRRETPYIDRWIDCLSRCFPDRSKAEATTATFAVLSMLNSAGTWPQQARKGANLPELVADLALGGVYSLGQPSRATA